MRKVLCYLCIAMGTIMSLNAGEVLGVSYDEVWVARLKYPEGSKGKYSAVDEKGQPTNLIEDARKIRSVFHKKIDKLFPAKGYDNGLADARLQLYSLVFYKSGEIVLTITPNLVGGDLYASDIKGGEHDARSLSQEQKNKFLNLIHICLTTSARAEKVSLPREEPGQK